MPAYLLPICRSKLNQLIGLTKRQPPRLRLQRLPPHRIPRHQHIELTPQRIPRRLTLKPRGHHTGPNHEIPRTRQIPQTFSTPRRCPRNKPCHLRCRLSPSPCRHPQRAHNDLIALARQQPKPHLIPRIHTRIRNTPQLPRPAKQHQISADPRQLQRHVRIRRSIQPKTPIDHRTALLAIPNDQMRTVAVHPKINLLQILPEHHRIASQAPHGLHPTSTRAAVCKRRGNAKVPVHPQLRTIPIDSRSKPTRGSETDRPWLAGQPRATPGRLIQHLSRFRQHAPPRPCRRKAGGREKEKRINR